MEDKLPVAALRSALPSLTEDDARTLLRRMQRVQHGKDEAVIAAGAQHASLMLIAEGSVRIEKEILSRAVGIAHVKAGELLGEISYLDAREGAAASVVADEPTVMHVIATSELETLLAEDDAFGARFFRSIAVVLARRMRNLVHIGDPSFTWG